MKTAQIKKSLITSLSFAAFLFLAPCFSVSAAPAVLELAATFERAPEQRRLAGNLLVTPETLKVEVIRQASLFKGAPCPHPHCGGTEIRIETAGNLIWKSGPVGEPYFHLLEAKFLATGKKKTIFIANGNPETLLPAASGWSVGESRPFRIVAYDYPCSLFAQGLKTNQNVRVQLWTDGIGGKAHKVLLGVAKLIFRKAR